MAIFIARRVVTSIGVIAVILVVVFFLLRIAGNDPAYQGGNIFTITPAVVKEYRHDFGLDRSKLAQLGSFVSGLLHGTLGTSFRDGTPVTTLIARTAPKSLLLGGCALCAVLLLSGMLGVLAAAKPGSWLDRGVIALTVVGQSVPVFWIAILLVLVFAIRLGWFPATGYSGVGSLVLPVGAVVLGELPWQLRVVRSEMLDVLREDYIVTARAGGLRKRQVLFKYGLRNAAVAWLSVLGVQAGWLLGGVFVVEAIFNYPGMGALMVQAVSAGDFPVVQGVALVSAAVFVVFNLAVDVAYTVVDPRIRL